MNVGLIQGRMRRLTLRGFVGAAFGYGLLAAVVGCSQRRLIYYPPSITAAEMAAAAADGRYEPWMNAAGERIGWKRAGVRPASEGVVLIVHGNAGAAVERGYLADPLQSGTGLGVHVLEYPGFSGRAGSPSEESLSQAALEGMDLLSASGPVFVVGESLGTGVAAILAGSRPEKVAGVILLTPFDSLTKTAGYHYPWLPVGTLLRDRYESVRWLERYRGPVAVVVGTADRVVPAERGKALYEAYAGPKRLWVFEGESHWEASHRPAEWWEEAFRFLRTPGVAPGVSR